MSVVEEVIQSEVELITRFMPEVRKMSTDTMREVLVAYKNVFSIYTAPWLAMTWTRCQSGVAWEVCHSNLVREDPRILQRFVRNCLGSHNVTLNACTFDRTKKLVRLISREIEDSHINGLLVMALLEKCSPVFISVLDEIAVYLGATDLEYTQKLGEANKDRSQGFICALESEYALHPDELWTHAYVIEYMEQLLQAIFTIPERQGI